MEAASHAAALGDRAGDVQCIGSELGGGIGKKDRRRGQNNGIAKNRSEVWVPA